MTESSGDNIKIHIKTSQAEKVEILTSSTRTGNVMPYLINIIIIFVVVECDLMMISVCGS